MLKKGFRERNSAHGWKPMDEQIVVAPLRLGGDGLRALLRRGAAEVSWGEAYRSCSWQMT